MLLMKLWEVYKEKVLGIIKGLDRIRFRGTLRWLSSERGMNTFMASTGMLLKDFGKWAGEKTEKLRSSCEQQANSLRIPITYLNSSSVDKEKLAKKIAEENGIAEDGSICMFSVVERCVAPAVSGNKEKKQLELKYRVRKCVHIYHYFDHPELGFGHVRLQSWLPFGVTLCLNGRHWLEKQLAREGVRFVKSGNCFPWLEDIERAQKLMDEQLKTNWPVLLDRLVLNACPQLPGLMSPMEFDYYWSAEETEWATDIMFSDDCSLNRLYPQLPRHAMIVSDSPAVMRYLSTGKPKKDTPKLGHLPEDIVSDCRRRHEGMRVKHWIRNNSIKLYNKTATLLRIETTINATRDFKVFRSPNDDPKREPSWQRMRKGVSDLHRRCEVSNSANNRYAEALGTALVQDKLKDVLGPACERLKKKGRNHRAINPWSSQDFPLISFFGKGELAINGFRNKDLRHYLYGELAQDDRLELRRLSGRVSRLIALLRAHGLIRKVPGVNRYIPPEKGSKISTALLCASAVDINTLMDLAA